MNEYVTKAEFKSSNDCIIREIRIVSAKLAIVSARFANSQAKTPFSTIQAVPVMDPSGKSIFPEIPERMGGLLQLGQKKFQPQLVKHLREYGIVNLYDTLPDLSPVNDDQPNDHPSTLARLTLDEAVSLTPTLALSTLCEMLGIDFELASNNKRAFDQKLAAEMKSASPEAQQVKEENITHKVRVLVGRKRATDEEARVQLPIKRQSMPERDQEPDTVFGISLAELTKAHEFSSPSVESEDYVRWRNATDPESPIRKIRNADSLTHSLQDSPIRSRSGSTEIIPSSKYKAILNSPSIRMKSGSPRDKSREVETDRGPEGMFVKQN